MKKLLLAASACAGLAFAQPASAGLLAQYSLDNGATFTPICSDISGGSCSDTFTAGGLNFLVFAATSNSPGTPDEANLFSTTLRLTNTSGSTKSILLSVGDVDFTAPIGAVSFLNNVSGTVTTGGAGNLLSSIACIDSSNGQNTCPATYNTPAIVANITAPGVGAATTTLPIAGLAGPYSMTELISITLDNGSEINYVSSSTVEPVPEPASLGILGLGLLGMGMIRARRRNG